MNNKKIAKATQCIWSGEATSLMQGATQVPVVHSVGFGYKDVDEWQQVALGEKPGHIYLPQSSRVVALDLPNLVAKFPDFAVEENRENMTMMRMATPVKMQIRDTLVLLHR